MQSIMRLPNHAASQTSSLELRFDHDEIEFGLRIGIARTNEVVSPDELTLVVEEQRFEMLVCRLCAFACLCMDRLVCRRPRFDRRRRPIPCHATETDAGNAPLLLCDDGERRADKLHEDAVMPHEHLVILVGNALTPKARVEPRQVVEVVGSHVPQPNRLVQDASPSSLISHLG